MAKRSINEDLDLKWKELDLICPEEWIFPGTYHYPGTEADSSVALRNLKFLAHFRNSVPAVPGKQTLFM